jgi:opacity protein-like surface antigen
MKKYFSVMVGLLMLLSLPSVSFAYFNAPGPYFSGQLGMATMTNSDLSDGETTATLTFEPGFASALAGGFNFGMFRIEGEWGYQKNEIDKIKGYDYNNNEYYSEKISSGDMAVYSFLGNIYLDFVNPSPVTPYLTAGMGMARVELNDFFHDNYDDSVLAYQVGAGLAFQINPHFTIDLKYRYFATEKPDFDGIEANLASHNVYCGFRVNF